MTSSSDALASWPLPDFGAVMASCGDNAPDLEAAAWDRGWAAGQAAAAEQAERDLASDVSARQVAAQAIDAASTALRNEMQLAVPALALAIARILIEREVAVDPSVMQHLVHRALAITPLHGTIGVRLHPDDLAAIGSGDGAVSAATVTGELRWMPDESLSRGSCVVEGPVSIVDGRIDRVLLDLYDRMTHD